MEPSEELRLVLAEAQRKVFGAIERDNFSMWKDRDVRSFLDPPNQIARHGVCQPV